MSAAKKRRLDLALQAFAAGQPVVVQFGTTTGLFFPLFSREALTKIHQVKKETTPVGKRPITLVANIDTILSITDFEYLFGAHTPPHKQSRQQELETRFWSLDPVENLEGQSTQTPARVPNLAALRRLMEQVAIFRLPLRADAQIQGRRLPEWGITFDPEENINFVQVVNFGALGGEVQEFFDQLILAHQAIGCTSANDHGQPEIVDPAVAEEFARKNGLAYLGHHHQQAFAAQPGSYTILSFGRVSEKRADFVRIERHGNLHADTIRRLWGEEVEVSPDARPANYPSFQFPKDLLDQIFDSNLTSYQRSFLMNEVMKLILQGRDTMELQQIVTAYKELL